MCNKTLRKNDLDWSQSRILFVSPYYTIYQKQSINFKDLLIELWEVKRFENGLLSFEQIQKTDVKESIKTISHVDKNIDNVTKEIKVYNEQDHLNNVSPEIVELYEKFKNAIQNLDNIEIKPKKKYIAFVYGHNVIDILPQKKALKMWINMSKGELDDSKKLTRDVSSTGHWGNGDYEIQTNNDDDLEYILSLVKQSIKKNKK